VTGDFCFLGTSDFVVLLCRFLFILSVQNRPDSSVMANLVFVV